MARFSFLVSLLAFSLFISCAFAAQTPLEKFLNDSFEPDQNVAASQLIGSDCNCLLITADEIETYVVDSSGKPVYDAARIEAMLVGDLKNRSGFEERKYSAENFAEMAAAAKRKDEAQCMLLTGTDMHDCSDKPSCILACKSNPNCDILLYSDGFWEAILEWTDDRKGFEAALVEFDMGSELVTEDPSRIDAKMLVLDDLFGHASDMAQSTLFLTKDDAGCSGKNATKRCYEYCAKTDYSVARIGEQRQNLAALKSLVLQIALQGDRAAAIVNRSRENDAYEAAKGKKHEEFMLRALNEMRKLNESDAEMQAKVNDSIASGQVAQLYALSLQIDILADAGFHRKAAQKEIEFGRKLNETKDRMENNLNQLLAINRRADALGEKIGNATWVLGSATATEYIATVEAVRTSLGKPTTIMKISEAGAQMDGIEANLSSVMLEKASQGGAQVPATQDSGLPIVPIAIGGLVLFVGAAFFFMRKRRV